MIATNDGVVKLATSLAGELCIIGDTLQVYLQEGIIKKRDYSFTLDAEGKKVFTNPIPIEYPVPARWALCTLTLAPNAGFVVRVKEVYYPNGKPDGYTEPISKIKLNPSSRIFFKASELINNEVQIVNLLVMQGRKTIKKIAERQGLRLS